MKHPIALLTTRAARRYVSPGSRPPTREEAETRALAYLLKDPLCDPDLINAAAREMARLIQGERGYLIPVPDHHGRTAANDGLARAIRDALPERSFTLANILTRYGAIDSACQRHKLRLPPLPPESHGIQHANGRSPVRLTGSEKIYFVDNVITSGNTIEACRLAMCGLGTGLVYADASHPPLKHHRSTPTKKAPCLCG